MYELKLWSEGPSKNNPEIRIEYSSLTRIFNEYFDAVIFAYDKIEVDHVFNKKSITKIG